MCVACGCRSSSRRERMRLLVAALPLLCAALASCVTEVPMDDASMSLDQAKAAIRGFELAKLGQLRRGGGRGKIGDDDIVVTDDFFTDIYCARKRSGSYSGYGYTTVWVKRQWRLRRVPFRELTDVRLSIVKGKAMAVLCACATLGFCFPSDCELSVSLRRGAGCPRAFDERTAMELNIGSYGILRLMEEHPTANPSLQWAPPVAIWDWIVPRCYLPIEAEELCDPRDVRLARALSYMMRRNRLGLGDSPN